MKIEELARQYRTLCVALGRDNELESMPESREELIRGVQELNFEWMHKYHIG